MQTNNIFVSHTGLLGMLTGLGKEGIKAEHKINFLAYSYLVVDLINIVA